MKVLYKINGHAVLKPIDIYIEADSDTEAQTKGQKILKDLCEIKIDTCEPSKFMDEITNQP